MTATAGTGPSILVTPDLIGVYTLKTSKLMYPDESRGPDTCSKAVKTDWIRGP